MSWQIGAFLILGIALAVGFGWYERARPDARIVALVATLAALAAIGRIAFAAIPNVKPTTDIVLISGYALGGAPGFAVGAITGLTSNFFFGQGPWTPWQMAAWGATGIVGAGLALATRRRISRWPLAIACGVVGFWFTAFQDVGDWVTYSDHTLGALGVYVGKGIGFDLVHAIGCVLFALLFGLPLTRSIQRFARRLHVRWEPAAGVATADARAAGEMRTAATRTAAVLLAILFLGGWLAGQPGSEGMGALEGQVGLGGQVALAASLAPSPTSYLLGAQNADGGFGAAPGQPSSPLYSGWAALGLAAAGQNPQAVRHGGATLLDYVRATAGTATDPGSVERTILVAHAAGVSPGAFGGQNLVARLEQRIRADGSVNRQVNLTSFAVLALRAAGVPPPVRTMSWLLAQEDRDGGFNFASAGGVSDVDDTGAALEAVAGAGGAANRVRAHAVRFIARQQDRDGGFPSQPGGESNAQSTAWAIQGLLAAGVDPNSLHRHGAPSPSQFLASLIAGDGHVLYERSLDQTPVWVTAQALMALNGKALPLASVPLPVAHPHARTRAARRMARRHRRASVRRHVGRRPPKRPASTDHALSRLAADAACVAALALGPVGLG